MADIVDSLGIAREDYEAGVGIAEMSSEASGLVVGIIQKNASEHAKMQARIDAWKQQELDEWKERALLAEAELAAVRSRFMDLLHPSLDEIERFKRQ